MTKRRIIIKILEYLDAIPIQERKRLDGITFIAEDSMIKMDNGGCFVRGQYFPDNSIIFYAPLIPTEKDLKETFLHELAHHVGMNEKQVGRFITEVVNRKK